MRGIPVFVCDLLCRLPLVKEPPQREVLPVQRLRRFGEELNDILLTSRKKSD
jgi:hypothetical protein